MRMNGNFADIGAIQANITGQSPQNITRTHFSLFATINA